MIRILCCCTPCMLWVIPCACCSSLCGIVLWDRRGKFGTRGYDRRRRGPSVCWRWRWPNAVVQRRWSKAPTDVTWAAVKQRVKHRVIRVKVIRWNSVGRKFKQVTAVFRQFALDIPWCEESFLGPRCLGCHSHRLILKQPSCSSFSRGVKKMILTHVSVCLDFRDVWSFWGLVIVGVMLVYVILGFGIRSFTEVSPWRASLWGIQSRVLPKVAKPEKNWNAWSLSKTSRTVGWPCPSLFIII